MADPAGESAHPQAPRVDYTGDGLVEADVLATPYRQARRWVDEAVTAAAERPDVPEPTALSVATADADGAPNVRTVLMRFFDERGPGFVTNLESAKSLELRGRAAHRRSPHLALDLPGGPLPGPGRAARARRGRRLLHLPPLRLPALGLGLGPVPPRRRPGRDRGEVGAGAGPLPPGRRGRRGRGRRVRCRCPTSGAGGGSSATRSSSGRAGATGCTTGSSSPATGDGDLDDGAVVAPLASSALSGIRHANDEGTAGTGQPDRGRTALLHPVVQVGDATSAWPPRTFRKKSLLGSPPILVGWQNATSRSRRRQDLLSLR